MPRCPSCYIPMTRTEEDGLKSFTCSQCFGELMQMVALQRRMNLDSQQGYCELPGLDSIADLAEIVAASHTLTELRCPACEKMMLKERFHAMIPVIIDRCKPCGSVWMDTGEFSLIRVLHRELMTTDDPELIRRREKIAGAFAAWESRDPLRREPATGISGPTSDLETDAFDLIGYLLRR